MKQEIKRCTCCILPETYPGIKFNSDGVCNVCMDYDRTWKTWNEAGYIKSKIILEQIVKNAKELKRKYDCIVPFSGGKDSTYVLYICRKVFNMKVLAVNFDNGFQTNEAFQNIKNAVELLDTDLVIYKPAWLIMKNLISCFLLNTGEGCTPWKAGIGSIVYKIAKQERIPLIINGCSPRSDERSHREIYFPDKDYFLNVVTKNGLLNEVKESLYSEQIDLYKFISRVSRRITRLSLTDASIFKFLPKKYLVWNTLQISLPDYMKWNENEIYSVLIKELNWKESYVGKEHTDCHFNPVKCYLRFEKWGFGSKTQKLSALVRDGQMAREEALHLIKDEGKIPANINSILERLDLTPDKLEHIKNQHHIGYL